MFEFFFSFKTFFAYTNFSLFLKAKNNLNLIWDVVDEEPVPRYATPKILEIL